MTHLKCQDHGRRVLVLNTAKGVFDHNPVLHRSDGTLCPTPTVLAGKNRLNPDLIKGLLSLSRKAEAWVDKTANDKEN